MPAPKASSSNREPSQVAGVASSSATQYDAEKQEVVNIVNCGNGCFIGGKLGKINIVVGQNLEIFRDPLRLQLASSGNMDGVDRGNHPLVDPKEKCINVWESYTARQFPGHKDKANMLPV